MDGSEVVAKLMSLGLKDGSYIVFGSGPMAPLGIRKVNDIDLLVTTEVRKELKKSGWKEISKGPKDTPIVFGDFEAHDNWNFSSYSPTLSELLSRAFVFQGVTFASIEDVRKWKQSSGRPKDKKDIELINQYLESSGKS